MKKPKGEESNTQISFKWMDEKSANHSIELLHDKEVKEAAGTDSVNTINLRLVGPILKLTILSCTITDQMVFESIGQL